MNFCNAVHCCLSIFREFLADVLAAQDVVVSQFLVDFFDGLAALIEIYEEVTVTVTGNRNVDARYLGQFSLPGLRRPLLKRLSDKPPGSFRSCFSPDYCWFPR